jgi:hypothetical protein
VTEPSTPAFVPGLALSRQFYEQAVHPILRSQFPRLKHAAALIGPGSEVLGYDTPISSDHHWGPRVMLFLDESDLGSIGADVTRVLSDQLPHRFMGYPTNFGPPDTIGVRLLVPSSAGPVNHRVELLTVRRFFNDYLGWDPSNVPTLEEWLTFPEHRLRAVTAGAVFSDPAGTLAQVRERLAWYPHDLWLYLMAAEWNRIADEEAFVGRTGDLGDEIGSRLIAGRIVESLMRLCFLLERAYPPYSKWFGTAFTQLACAPTLVPLIAAVLNAVDWREREAALSAAYKDVVMLHNEAGLTEPIDPGTSPYHDRPFQVIHADRIVGILRNVIGDERVRTLPIALGSVNQLVASSTTAEQQAIRMHLRLMYLS